MEAAKEEQPDAVLLCGDIYDKTIPSAEAVSLFDWFLTELKETLPKAPILIIAGNHDSGGAVRICTGTLRKRGRVHCRSAAGSRRKDPKSDDDGSCREVCFYLLPFTKPSHLRKKYEEEKIDAMKKQ